MKKIIVIALLLTIVFAFCSCKSEEVRNVEQLISDLETISDGDEKPIILAENAYNALDEENQQQVDGALKILEAREKFDNKERADNVIDKINVIMPLTLESENAINEARLAYDQLSETQKEMVDNYSVLLEAETSYLILQVENATTLIGNIGTVALDSEKAINAAQNAYNNLSAELKQQVKNHNTLIAALNTISQLKVSHAIDLINSIGEVTISSEDAIALAEKAYRVLSANEANMVTNISTLTEKRSEYDILAARAIIRVTRIWCSKPDSAGGVELYFNFINNSEKVIKYIKFGATFYNAVEDVVTSKYQNNTINYCLVTGPYEKGNGLKGSHWYWGDYYNWEIKTVKLVSLEIEYMDSTKITLTTKQLGYVQY